MANNLCLAGGSPGPRRSVPFVACTNSGGVIIFCDISVKPLGFNNITAAPGDCWRLLVVIIIVVVVVVSPGARARTDNSTTCVRNSPSPLKYSVFLNFTSRSFTFFSHKTRSTRNGAAYRLI